jgi:hypothetical protein
VLPSLGVDRIGTAWERLCRQATRGSSGERAIPKFRHRRGCYGFHPAAVVIWRGPMTLRASRHGALCLPTPLATVVRQVSYSIQTWLPFERPMRSVAEIFSEGEHK